jgi:hypothetical protein
LLRTFREALAEAERFFDAVVFRVRFVVVAPLALRADVERLRFAGFRAGDDFGEVMCRRSLRLRTISPIDSRVCPDLRLRAITKSPEVCNKPPGERLPASPET